MDHDFRARFSELTLRLSESLSDDERESLQYFLAADDVFLGCPVNTPARCWASMAWRVARLVRELGRMPEEEDPSVAPEVLGWIARQHRGRLNSYQRARLEAMRGWRYPAE